MTTQSFSADSAKQYVGTPMNAPAGMVTILMKTNRYYTDGTLLKTGVSYSVTTAWAKTAVDSGWAADVPRVFPEIPAPGGLTAAQVSAVQALVSGAGNPTDLLTGTLQHVTITGAISTTVALTATAIGTYTKARVAWNNNGASASAKLRIAVNTDNDVHGLMVSQSAKRRDYEMTMGDGVMLVCGVPITRLTFSADGAITGGTHQLQVTFGN